jgi:hypothetical protein
MLANRARLCARVRPARLVQNEVAGTDQPSSGTELTYRDACSLV